MQPVLETTTPRTLRPLDSRRSTASWRDWMSLAVLVLPVLLISLDNTALTIALPRIAADLHPTGVQQLWIIDVYALIIAGLLVTMGSVADRYGHRRVLLIGATGFATVSIVGAFAPTPELLIAARAALAFFGSMLMPSTLSLLRSIFTSPRDRQLAIAIWGSTFGAGGALGPIVGGVLLEHFWWGSVFLLSVPVLLPLLIGGRLLLPATRRAHADPIDPPSVMLSLVGMVAVVYAVKTLASDTSIAITVGSAAVGVAFLAFFVARQRTLRTPLLDLELLRIRSFSGAVLVNLCSYLALAGFVFFLAQDLLVIHGLSPLRVGLLLVPGALVLVIASVGVVPLRRRFSPRAIIVAGLCISGVGYLGTPVVTESVTATLLCYGLVAAGVGLAETVATDVIVAEAPDDRAGAASAISETGYEFGALLGTVLLGGVLTVAYRSNVVVPEEITGEARVAAMETLGGAKDAAASTVEPAGQALMASAADAFTSGIGVTCGVAGVLMAVVAVGASRVFRDVR